MGTSPTASAASQQPSRQRLTTSPSVGPALPGMFDRYRPQVEQAMAGSVPPAEQHVVNSLLRYHLGWSDRNGVPSSTPASQGKALRPTLCIFACEALQGEPGQAAPAAAALELIHNFSLVHDDIQDEGYERRHQPTVWALWGTPRALVAGDAMQSLGDLATLGFNDGIPANTAIRVSSLLTDSYLEMIEGQCRDLQFEQRDTITADEYLDMTALKTGALIRCSMEIGATIATDDAATISGVARFGRSVGRLFQIRDDYLGIWGDEAITGKSTDSDIVQRKKSYPIVFAFQETTGAAALPSCSVSTPRNRWTNQTSTRLWSCYTKSAPPATPTTSPKLPPTKPAQLWQCSNCRPGQRRMPKISLTFSPTACFSAVAGGALAARICS